MSSAKCAEKITEAGGACTALVFQPDGPANKLGDVPGYEQIQAGGGFAQRARAVGGMRLTPKAGAGVLPREAGSRCSRLG